MGRLAARIYGDGFSRGKRHVRRIHADERRSGIATPQRIALLMLSELDQGLMIEIVMVLAFDGVLVLHVHVCNEAKASRTKPEEEKTRNREPGKDAMEPENHERDCSDKEPMNQVPFSVDAMPFWTDVSSSA